MKKQLLTLFCLTVFTNSIYAIENTSTVTITFINHSNDTLTYIANNGQKPDNTFSNPPITIKAGDTAIIQGTSTYAKDLVGQLIFKNTLGQNSLFTVIDNRKIKYGQPVFAFSSSHQYASTLISKTYNEDPNGKALTYSAATVEITNK